MGIQGLLPFLRSIQRESHLKHWAGKTLAIDGYVWLHRGAYHCAQELCLGSPTKKHVEYFVQKIKLLHAFGVTAYVVFDGDHLPSKKITEDDRENRRRTALTNANRLLAQGDQKKAREEFVKAVDVTPQLAYDVILALRSMGVKYVVAPYEADAQLRFLEMKGEVDGIITEDSDLLVYGAQNVLFKMDPSGNCIHISRKEFGLVDDKRMSLWTEQEFRQMAMLSGCDYLSSIPGLGIKKAHDLIRRHKTAEKAIKATRLDGKLCVPPKYEQSFHRAELTFKHQFVFDHSTRAMIPLNPLPEPPPSPESLTGCGAKWPDQVAIDVAEGRVDPFTKQPFSAQSSPGLKHLPPLRAPKPITTKPSTQKRPALSSAKQSTLNMFAFKPSSSIPQVVSSTPSRPTTTTISHDSTCSKGLESINATSSKFFDCQTSKQPDISCAEFDSESQGFVATQTTVEDLRAEDATPLTQEGWDAISEMSIEGPVDAKLEDVRRDMEFDKLIGDDLPSSQMHDPFNVSVTLPTISRPESHPYSSLSPISSSYSASNKENCEPSFKEDYFDSSVCPSSSQEIENKPCQNISDGVISSSDLDEGELTITKPRVTIITPNNHNSMSTAANCRRASEPISRQTRQLPISSDPILSSDEDNDENDRTKVLDSGLNNRRKGAKSTSHSHQPFKRVCRGFVETPSSKLSKLAKRSGSTVISTPHGNDHDLEEISPSLARVASGIRNRFTYQKPSSSSSEKRLPIGKPKLFDFSRKSSSSNSNSNSNNEVENQNQNNSKTSSSEKRLSTTSTTSHRKSCQLPLGTSSSTILNDLSDDHTKKNESDLQPYLSLKCQPNSKKSTSKKQSLCNTSSIKSVPTHPAPLTSTRTTSNKLSMFIFRGNVN
ncbi:hypothetical protein MJO29_003381 [Puccinia striiformis f. sp. tritici]|nr:hypothetical protein MJO29_003381 [Puccinia striiformis f. sp. tritici]